MLNRENIKDITLGPGEFFFGSDEHRICTILGSCIAISIWHPQRRIGGMCHYMLPTANSSKRLAQGYYADGAMQLFLKAIYQHCSFPEEYEVKIFGGSNMFESMMERPGTINVSKNNIEIGINLLQQYGFRVKASDVGGFGHRKLYFELWTGDVWVRHGKRRVNNKE